MVEMRPLASVPATKRSSSSTGEGQGAGAAGFARRFLETFLQFLLVVVAIQDGGGLGVVFFPQKRFDVRLVAPQVGHGTKVPVSRERVRQHDAVDAAGRGATNDVYDDVGIDQLFDEAIDALAANGAVKLLRHSVFIYRQGDSAVENQPQPNLTRACHDRSREDPSCQNAMSRAFLFTVRTAS